MASAFDDPVAPSLCDLCGNATEGTIRCSVQDSKNLCQGCFQDLPQARREDIGDSEWVCDIHSHRKADIFCETCQLGCCTECAVDVHKGHNVVNGLKHVGEIRCDLTQQLQEVDVRLETLFELRRKIESSLRKIEEAPALLNKYVDEMKEEVAKNLEREVHRIQWETQLNIIHQERRRDDMLKLAKEKADLDIQRIQEMQRGISTGLLKDAEKRRCKIHKAESKLLVGQQACESANLEIKSLLESTPEKLAYRGRRLCSLVKASSSFQCQDDVLDSCREVEADLPELNFEKDYVLNDFRTWSLLVKFAMCVYIVLYFASEARVRFRDEYNRLLSSESTTSFIMLCLYFPMYYAVKCFLLTFLLACRMYAYPITRKESLMKKLNSYIKIVLLASGLCLLTVLFLILVSYLLYLFQVKSVSANIVSIMSILQSCSFLYGLQNSKTFKDYWDYQKLYKF